jgi:hypothetical protein
MRSKQLRTDERLQSIQRTDERARIQTARTSNNRHGSAFNTGGGGTLANTSASYTNGNNSTNGNNIDMRAVAGGSRAMESSNHIEAQFANVFTHAGGNETIAMMQTAPSNNGYLQSRSASQNGSAANQTQHHPHQAHRDDGSALLDFGESKM